MFCFVAVVYFEKGSYVAQAALELFIAEVSLECQILLLLPPKLCSAPACASGLGKLCWGCFKGVWLQQRGGGSWGETGGSLCVPFGL